MTKPSILGLIATYAIVVTAHSSPAKVKVFGLCTLVSTLSVGFASVRAPVCSAGRTARAREWASAEIGSECFGLRLARADTDGLLQVAHKDFSVSYLAGLRGADNGLQYTLQLVVCDANLKFYLW